MTDDHDALGQWQLREVQLSEAQLGPVGPRGLHGAAERPQLLKHALSASGGRPATNARTRPCGRRPCAVSSASSSTAAVQIVGTPVAGARKGQQAAGQVGIRHVLRRRRPRDQRAAAHPALHQQLAVERRRGGCLRLTDALPRHHRAAMRAAASAARPGPRPTRPGCSAARRSTLPRAVTAIARDGTRQLSVRGLHPTRAEQAHEHRQEHDPGQPEEDGADELQQLRARTPGPRPPGTRPLAPRECRWCLPARSRAAGSRWAAGCS